MAIVLLIGIPVLVIFLILTALKLTPGFSYGIILLLSAITPIATNVVYCNVLNTQCTSDAMAPLGYAIQALAVFFITVLLYTLVRKVRKPAH